MRDLESSAHQDLVSGEGIGLVGWVGWVGLGSALKPGSQVGFAERLVQKLSLTARRTGCQ